MNNRPDVVIPRSTHLYGGGEIVIHETWRTVIDVDELYAHLGARCLWRIALVHCHNWKIVHRYLQIHIISRLGFQLVDLMNIHGRLNHFSLMIHTFQRLIHIIHIWLTYYTEDRLIQCRRLKNLLLITRLSRFTTILVADD